MTLFAGLPTPIHWEWNGFMPDNRLQVDGARVLADLTALRDIGAYKTGVHKPTFSEPHMRSLEWLWPRPPEAGVTAEIDGIGNCLGTRTKTRPKMFAGSHPHSPNFSGWPHWAVSLP